MTLSPVASTFFPPIGTPRTASVKAWRLGPSSSLASGRAVTTARRPTFPSRSRKRSSSVAGASTAPTRLWASRSRRMGRRRSRSFGSTRARTRSDSSARMSRSSDSFASWSRGTTLEIVSHPSISRLTAGCRMRARMASQNCSASSRESSRATEPAIDFPRDDCARSWSRRNSSTPRSSLLNLSRLRSMECGSPATNRAPAAAVAAANPATIARGWAKSHSIAFSPIGRAAAARAGVTGRIFSNTERSAGASAKVATQQNSIPIPPINPKWRNPRLPANASTPKDTLVAAEARSVAIAVVRAPSSQAEINGSPARRSCFTRAR